MIFFFFGVELYLNGGQGERCCFIYCLGLAGIEALDVAEIPGYWLILEHAVNKEIFLFFFFLIISPKIVFREEILFICDGCSLQRQTPGCCQQSLLSFSCGLCCAGRGGWKQVLRTGIFSTSRAVLCQHNPSHPSEILGDFVGSLAGVKAVLWRILHWTDFSAVIKWHSWLGAIFRGRGLFSSRKLNS